MAETPEEVAMRLLEEITDCENGYTAHRDCIPPSLGHLASALRAQYVAGLERGAGIADAMQVEDEAEWNKLGGEGGTPDWYVEHRSPTNEEYIKNCYRLAFSGGADTAERIAAAIRELAEQAKRE